MEFVKRNETEKKLPESLQPIEEGLRHVNRYLAGELPEFPLLNFYFACQGINAYFSIDGSEDASFKQWMREIDGKLPERPADFSSQLLSNLSPDAKTLAEQIMSIQRVREEGESSQIVFFNPGNAGGIIARKPEGSRYPSLHFVKKNLASLPGYHETLENIFINARNWNPQQ